MHVKSLAVASVALAFAVPAVPAFAQADKGSDHAGPIPYSELAAADAKLNGAGGTGHKAKRHAARHKAATKTAAAASSGSTGAAASAGTGAAGSAPAR